MADFSYLCSPFGDSQTIKYCRPFFHADNIRRKLLIAISGECLFLRLSFLSLEEFLAVDDVDAGRETGAPTAVLHFSGRGYASALQVVDVSVFR